MSNLNPDIAAGWRPICSKRARKLKRRGEDVQWRPALDSLAWRPHLWLSCPGCGYAITPAAMRILVGSARFDYDCPRCHLYTLGDFT